MQENCFYDLSIDFFPYGTAALFTCSWAANALFQNVVDSIAFLNITVDSTSSDVCRIPGHSIYRMMVSHWKIFTGNLDPWVNHRILMPGSFPGL